VALVSLAVLVLGVQQVAAQTRTVSFPSPTTIIILVVLSVTATALIAVRFGWIQFSLVSGTHLPMHKSCVPVKMVQRTFTVRLKRDEESGYYAARCVELPEAISQGKTEEEAVANLREALELVLEEYESDARKEGGKLIPIVV
jgi:predicted RNase H-like HicB family nuclease